MKAPSRVRFNPADVQMLVIKAIVGSEITEHDDAINPTERQDWCDLIRVILLLLIRVDMVQSG